MLGQQPLLPPCLSADFGCFTLPAVVLPFSQLQPVPGISANPLFLVLLEMILRSSTTNNYGTSSSSGGGGNSGNSSTDSSGTSWETNSSERSSRPDIALAALYLMSAVTQQLESASAAAPTWSVALPLIGALVSSSKVLKSKVLKSSALEMTDSFSIACKCYQVLLEYCFELLQTWMVGARGPEEGTDHGSPVGPSQQQQGQVLGQEQQQGSQQQQQWNQQQQQQKKQGQEQQQEKQTQQWQGKQQQQVKEEPQEQHLVMDSLRWALLSGAYALLDIVDERVWLALHLYKQLLCWEEVQEQIVAAAGVCEPQELATSYLTYMGVGSTLACRRSSTALDENRKAALATFSVMAASDLVTS